MTDETMSDEELSELAECLDDACREAVARGFRLVPYPERSAGRQCCPMGALISRLASYPYPGHRAVPLKQDIALPFMRGFDGHSNVGDERAYELGCQFRREYR